MHRFRRETPLRISNKGPRCLLLNKQILNLIIIRRRIISPKRIRIFPFTYSKSHRLSNFINTIKIQIIMPRPWLLNHIFPYCQSFPFKRNTYISIFISSYVVSPHPRRHTPLRNQICLQRCAHMCTFLITFFILLRPSFVDLV
jgi:hypothetical protein